MDFDLTEDQLMIRDTARDAAEKVLAPRAAEFDRTETFPRENLVALADPGADALYRRAVQLRRP